MQEQHRECVILSAAKDLHETAKPRGFDDPARSFGVPQFEFCHFSGLKNRGFIERFCCRGDFIRTSAVSPQSEIRGKQRFSRAFRNVGVRKMANVELRYSEGSNR